ncbi:Poly(A) RNA polymerase protein cid1 [Diplogelasinospora grovesii]|uniref:polynucleotide adenylyltransferase n=1 Tax=Diplogelasinospora grovesii TaxID=303347 RepID=A0AAN6N7P0_9PEZI|nr:Poly(A) RNA polymerase protein cid1 [Diplogelasinospora grovesii]
MEASQDGDGSLEKRLRGLILNHSGSETPGQAGESLPSLPSSEVPSKNTPTSQQPRGLEPKHLEQENSKASKKRPNQAQRRQMSAQLSIPIDPRPQPPQSAGSHAGPSAFAHQHQSRGGGQYRGQRPHSATFRLPHRPDAVANHSPMAGQPFSSQARHQQSLSYHGPISAPREHYDWGQPRGQGGDQRMGYHHPPPLMPYDAAAPRSSRNGHAPLYNPGKQCHVGPEELKAQADLLEGLCNTIIANAEIETADIIEKENFRAMIEQVARAVITEYERNENGVQDFPAASVQLRCFGSLSSGFATKAADMDLGLLSPCSRAQPDAPDSPIPRLIEKAFLDIGLGARLLTRTRVPIIKVCEKPPDGLRFGLLEERAKWEKGVIDVDEDDTQEETDHKSVDESHSQEHNKQGHRHKSPEASQDGRNSEQKLRSLKQSDKKSLAGYYGVAKGLLRKFGGRDITHSNLADFQEDDFRFLNEFCLAFVDGLADEVLRKRLLGYKSLNKYDLTVQHNHRTLAGVYTQIEGEQMAMMWESREVHEKDEHHEQLAQKCIGFWTNLQNKPNYGVDPLGYAKELQLAADQLRRIPSIQVMLLSQNQYESAPLYHLRAIRMMVELGGNDTPSKDNRILPVVIRHYIQGILSEESRKQVDEFAKSQEHVSLRAVARRHKSLQLAHEFERCLEKGLYPHASEANIRAYIGLLRAPMINKPSADSHFDFVVPLRPDSARITQDIRCLGNPSNMAPNQPRDPYRDRLEFPKSGVGVQCDINFSAHLALQNTLLLRCYSHCDARVRPLVLFVKHWAKVRGINTPYRGTLSSYGYVLMMLHYLVNVAQPFVCPNLQHLARPPGPHLTPEQAEEMTVCKGRNVRFWRDEAEIQRLAHENALSQNRDSIGYLLRGFFEYYAQSGFMSTFPSRGFDWGRDVLSLRTHGGLLTKHEKGWTGAKTVIEGVKSSPSPPAAPPSPPSDNPGQATPAPEPEQQQQQQHVHSSPRATAATAARSEVKEIRHRYLFAIEDPFELDHNVARTVTHNGIVAIRDEFRRAWRIIKNASKADLKREQEQFTQLLDELHGGL